MTLLTRLLDKVVDVGDLTVVDASGRKHRFGDGSGRPVTIRLHDKVLHTRLALTPRLSVGEAYMDGTLTVEEGTLYDFLTVFGRNVAAFEAAPLQRFGHTVSTLFRRLQQRNPVGRAQKHVAHHYDLSDDLYDLFLDSERQYSCAYFHSPGDSLDVAQDNKMRHIAGKLCLDRPGLRILDIGSGWGGLALHLARQAGAKVTGVTLSTEQHKVSERRAAELGLSDVATFHLKDYRHEAGPYDRIVSVGMFEHVGAARYGEFFAKVSQMLTDDGVALLHTIGRRQPPGSTNPWLRKYIFPGGYTPALSEILTAIERTGLYVTDIEVLRLHYAETLRQWHRRFQAHRDKAAQIYDERFCRMWEFYLVGCEIAFRYLGQVVFQIQLAKRQDAVPLTRDYIHHWELEQTAIGQAAD